MRPHGEHGLTIYKLCRRVPVVVHNLRHSLIALHTLQPLQLPLPLLLLQLAHLSHEVAQAPAPAHTLPDVLQLVLERP